MLKVRAWLERVRPLIVPGATSESGDKGRSVLARFAMPHSFGPDLKPLAALVAVAGSLARIFSACLLFAVWGGLAAVAWSAIANPFLRAVAMLAMFVMFLPLLAILMIAVSLVEKRMGAGR